MASDTSSLMIKSLLFMETKNFSMDLLVDLSTRVTSGKEARNQHQARNTSDWLGMMTATSNLKVENKSKKLNLDDWLQLKAGVPELDTKGLSIRLTVYLVEVVTMGMYINILPLGAINLMDECTKLGRDINSLAMTTVGIKSSVTGCYLVRGSIPHGEHGREYNQNPS